MTGRGGVADLAPMPSAATVTPAALLRVVSTVSFDVFDTLVTRRDLPTPTDVFVRMAALLPFPWRAAAPLWELRVRAEHLARGRARRRGHGEATLEEIHDELARLAGLEPAERATLVALERSVELEAAMPVATGVELLALAREAGCEIVATSDTAHDEATIRALLARAGIDAPARLVLSSAHRCTKAEGGLFDVLLSATGRAPGDVLHIGDNTHSDVASPSRRAIRTLHVPATRASWRRARGLDDRSSGSLWVSALASNERATLDADSETATDLAVLLAGTASWLVDRVRALGCSHVWFAAREGAILRRFFRLAADASGLEVADSYLPVSRAALYPSLAITAPAAALDVFAHAWDRLTLRTAFERVGIGWETARPAARRADLGDPDALLSPETREAFASALSALWPQVEDWARPRHDLLVRYLRSVGFFTPGRAAFVDLGWHGSLQNTLTWLLAEEARAVELVGCYLATFGTPAHPAPGFRAEGYLLTDDAPARRRDLVRAGPSLLELLTTAAHGRVTGYRLAASTGTGTSEGSVAVPVFAADADDDGLHAQQFETVIGPLQERAFDLAAATLATVVAGLPTNARSQAVGCADPDVVARIGMRPIYAPSTTEARRWAALALDTDVGAAPKSLTGLREWGPEGVLGAVLPDGQHRMWEPGARAWRPDEPLSSPR